MYGLMLLLLGESYTTFGNKILRVGKKKVKRETEKVGKKNE